MWKVRDIMQSHVVTVTPEMPVRELVQVLAKSRISGAPVVATNGDILGVVSATDVLALAAYGADAHPLRHWPDDEGADDEETASYFRTPETSLEFDTAGSEHVGEFLVKDIMTPAAFSVRSEDSITELARFLLRGRIHRALVVDESRLVGIATTFDVLHAVAANPGQPARTETIAAASKA
ncbi:MAG TPA: CBS domain-containing protein [Longimicrobiales bacterium]